MNLMQFDSSSIMGLGNDVIVPEEGCSNASAHDNCDSSTLGMGTMDDRGVHIHCSKVESSILRSRLVEHFDILDRQNKIKWPPRTGLSRSVEVDEPASL
jgi:hypothetical protein